MVQLAATFCDAPTILALRDETGIWYRENAGFSEKQWLDLEPALAQDFSFELDGIRFECNGYHLLHRQSLVDADRAIGFLWVISPEPRLLSATQREGLSQLVSQIQTLVISTQRRMERRTTQRGPSGASFVPGLVHELRNFIFGISGSLEAFEARFAEQKEAIKYGTVIRASLDRLNAFTNELHEYGDPQSLSWTERALEPLLWEAIEYHRALAQQNGVDIQVQIEGPLPQLKMDERSLRAAFIRLIDLALQQAEPGGHVMLHLATRLQREQMMIFGHLDASGLKLPGVDLTRLFEPFYYRASGLGRLGLPVARRIFETHGGNLSASLGPEGNLRMGFMLPTI